MENLYELKFYTKVEVQEDIEIFLSLEGLATNYFTEIDKENIKFVLYIEKDKIKNIKEVLEKKHIKIEISNNITTWHQANEINPYEFIEGIIINPLPDREIIQNGITINLIPGLAFGTGRHESTKIAAKLLIKANPYDKDILDIGCGSGILSVLSKKLGARYVKAVDIDPQAIEKTRETAKLNKTEIEIEYSDLTRNIKKKYDIIIANILFPTLKRILSDLKRITKKDSKIIFSGLYKDDYEPMKSLILQSGYKIEMELEMNGWHGFLFKN